MVAMRQYRLARARAQMERRDLGACLLYDMANIRYATGTRNMAVFTGHYPTLRAAQGVQGGAAIKQPRT